MIQGFNENGIIEARYTHNHILFDEPISIETAQGKFYYLFDGLGSVTGLTDMGGNLVATYSYDAFGNIVSETGDEALNAINPYRFTSRVYDKESGLYYYRARYYDGNTGRFTQKDPLRSELREGNNLYVYCGNNPVNRVDPSGLMSWSYSWVKVKVWWWWMKIGVDIKFDRGYTLYICLTSIVRLAVYLIFLVVIPIVGWTIFTAIMVGATIITSAACIYYYWGMRLCLRWYFFGGLYPIPLAW